MNLDHAYRITPEGNPRIYMNIRSAGAYYVDVPWQDRKFRHTFGELLWCSKGIFRVEGGTGTGLLHSGEACVLMPGDLHEVFAVEPGELYWLCFDGPNVQHIIDTFKLEHGVYQAGEVPKYLFHQIVTELQTPSAESEYAASATGYCILAMSLAGRESSDDQAPLYRRFLHLVFCHYGNPEFGIADYTAALNCHRSTLLRLMRKYHNCTPGEYLRSLRLKKAEELLRDTNLSIKEISRECGFEDPNYFAKVFRRFYKKQPSAFR